MLPWRGECIGKMKDNIYSVSEINNYIKSILDRDLELKNLQIVGEVSNFKRYPSGHCYFTLKDAGGILKCVMFRSKAMGLRFEPCNGDTVLAVGRLAVYERDGIYQLYTDLMLQQGAGDLMQAYERLKYKLEKEGLFAAEVKKSLPFNPHTVGVITSSAGAAVRDIITVSRRRNNGVHLLLYPVKVQGSGAASEIAKAIEFFNRQKLAEVLIVGRGGGSIEDLWAFNEERTVRAVAASKIPIVSAVGHETDFTLCDFAADVRAATPSQAAELVVTDVEECRRQVEYLVKRCQSLMRTYLMNTQHRVESVTASWTLKDPEKIFAVQEQRIDTAKKHIADAMQEELSKRQQAFALAIARMDSLSPLAVLGRGYTVTQKEDYTLVKSTAQINWGDELITTVSDGKIISLVQQIERR